MKLLKGSESNKMNIVLKEASHWQKFNLSFLFPESWHQFIYKFSKNLSTSLIGSHMSQRTALANKDRARRRFIDDNQEFR